MADDEAERTVTDRNRGAKQPGDDHDDRDEDSAAEAAASYADELDAALDPDEDASDPSFDVTTGDDLVDQLPSGEEVPGEVKREFWSTVLLLKIALLALSGAAIAGVFLEEMAIAGVLLAVGLLAGGRTLLKVREYQGS